MKLGVEVFRVEVWRDGELIEGRTFINHMAALTFADHQRARGLIALVMFPRAEATR